MSHQGNKHVIQVTHHYSYCWEEVNTNNIHSQIAIKLHETYPTILPTYATTTTAYSYQSHSVTLNTCISTP